LAGTHNTYEEVRVVIGVVEKMGNEQEDYFKVEVVKDSQSLTFSCCAHNDDIEVDTVSIATITSSGEMLGDAVSIPFNQLEEEGQNLFYDYLEARNIGADFCRVVAASLAEHEQVYYEQWAGKLKLFFD
jgi:hypothetical protein